MPWPYDTRFYTTSPNSPLPSALCNEVQDRIVDLYADQRITLMNAQCDLDINKNPTWGLDSSIERGWVCHQTGGLLVFPIEFREGESDSSTYMTAVLTAVRAKIMSDKSPQLRMNVYCPKINFEAPATSPTLGASIVEAVASESLWEVLTINRLTILIYKDRRLLVAISAGVGDIVAGVQITIQPL